MIKAKDKETGLELEFETLQELNQYLAQKKGQGTTKTLDKKGKQSGKVTTKEKKKYNKSVPFKENFKLLLQVLKEAKRPLIQEEARQKIIEKGVSLPAGGTASGFFKKARKRKEIFAIVKNSRKVYYTTFAMWVWFLKAADSNKDNTQNIQKPAKQNVGYGKRTPKGQVKRKQTAKWIAHQKKMRERGKFVTSRTNYLMKQHNWSREKAMSHASMEWKHKHNKKVKGEQSPNDVLLLPKQESKEIVIDGNAIEKEEYNKKEKHFPEFVGIGTARHKKKLKYFIKWLLKNPYQRTLNFSMFEEHFGFKNITEWDYFVESFKPQSNKIAEYFGVEDNFEVIYGGAGKDRGIAYLER